MPKTDKSISCIIPAYNEAERISNVLNAVLQVSHVNEILVIDDASTDNTKEIVKSHKGARLIEQSKNQGKSAAMARGIEEARGEYMLFLDADLLGIDADAIADLIAPVLSGKADMSLSLRSNSPWPWRAIGLDYITGERVMRRDFLASRTDEIRNLTGFGLEVYMNNCAMQERLRLAIVKWPNVKSPYKAAKFGFVEGMRREIGMLTQMFKTIPPHKAAIQIYQMRRSRV